MEYVKTLTRKIFEETSRYYAQKKVPNEWCAHSRKKERKKHIIGIVAVDNTTQPNMYAEYAHLKHLAQWYTYIESVHICIWNETVSRSDMHMWVLIETWRRQKRHLPPVELISMWARKPCLEVEFFFRFFYFSIISTRILISGWWWWWWWRWMVKISAWYSQ